MKARRIISLNLALLLLASLALPAGATQAARTDAPGEEGTLLTRRLDQIAADDGGEGAGPAVAEHVDEPAELSAGGDPYHIGVGDTAFYSNVDKSGAGWAYTAADHTLTLDGYQGGGISASGDLVIYAGGDNQITGQDSSYFGQDGIIVEGELEITVERDSTLRAEGGNGAYEAGQGVSADGTLTCWVYGNLIATGGDVTASNALGGDGLHSRMTVALYGQGAVTAKGGKGVNSMGGCGILSGFVYVGTESMIYGGSGKYGGDGIYFGNSCLLGVIEGVFTGGSATGYGGIDGYPIRGSASELKWYYDEHTNVREYGNSVLVSVKEYMLKILGNGGQRDGQTSFTDTQKYPAFYNLAEYIFQWDKYTQVGWQEESGGFIALDDLYVPEANTSLKAQWIMVDPGDIVINSLSGTLDDGTHYRSQRAALTLPTQITDQYGTASTVLAWSSTVEAQPDPTTKIMQGVWYEGGSVIQPDQSGVQLLYARTPYGAYVRYHPNGGAFQTGGTVLVQGTTATAEDLEVYAVGGETMTAPEGYAFKGWSRAANVDAVRYGAGERITVPAASNSNIVDLYAVWEQREFTQEIEAGAQVRYVPAAGSVKVELTDEWCREKGGETVIAAGFTDGAAVKLLEADAAPCGAGGARLAFQCSSAQPVKVRLFVLDENLAPVCEPREVVVFQPQG